mgnify:CR=1 FL=1
MKRTLIAIILVGAVSALVGAGTYAYFFDTADSTGNTFTAGTLDLKISDGDEPYADSVYGTWSMSNMKPGDECWGRILLKREGNIPADHLEITCDYIVIEESPQTPSDTDPNTNEHPDNMAKYMIITQMYYYNDNWNVDLLTDDGYDKGYDVSTGETGPKLTDYDGDGKLTLYDLKYAGLDNLWPPDGATHLEMRIKFDEDSGSDFQGDTLNLTMIFTLNQHPSQ